MALAELQLGSLVGLALVGPLVGAWRGRSLAAAGGDGVRMIVMTIMVRMMAVIDKSLDLEKISRRNCSYFSLSSCRIIFSFLFSIFKIFRKKISFFSRFARF